MTRSSLRAELYRGIQKHALRPLIVPRIFKNASERRRLFSELNGRFELGKERREDRKFPIAWFHAASVGELEMLTPIIEKWAALQIPSGEKTALVVTIFSESAEAQLKNLSGSLGSLGAHILFAGYCPWEGEWKEVLAKVSPDFVMTARYEAWPEMWMSLGESRVPLVVVGAKARSSLKWAKRACRWAGEALPELVFCSVRKDDLPELRREFPHAHFAVTGDPRWERVSQRAQAGNPRARELIHKFKELPRPWGVLGSVWKEDLDQWSEALRAFSKGTLWIAPHKIDDASVAPIEAFLDSCGISRVRARESLSSQPRCVVVNEMGFLAELYSAADWAYVGGGFGDGVHNTIEPAIYGIPVACGPKNAERFPEIELLESAGQLVKTTDAGAIGRWFSTIQLAGEAASAESRRRWKEHARSHLGASDAVLDTIWREIPERVSRWQLRK